MQFLDPDAVEAFVLVAELRSFTRAAQAMNTTQAAISLRIKRLEARIGQRLLERTPRHMRLSAAGERFLEAARDLVAAQRRASAALLTDRRRLAIGITHHVVGPNLPRLLRRMGALDSGLTLDLRVAETRGLLDLYDAGELDAVIVLRHDESRRGGRTVEPGQHGRLVVEHAGCGDVFDGKFAGQIRVLIHVESHRLEAGSHDGFHLGAAQHIGRCLASVPGRLEHCQHRLSAGR